MNKLARMAGVTVWLACALGGRAANITWNLNGGGNWDTSTANWTGDRTTYVDGSVDNVTFNKTAGGTIAVQGGGVTPLSTTISAGSGSYLFSGGSILGGTLTKSGAGTCILANPGNGFSSIAISGGTLMANPATAMGSAAVTLSTGATLSLSNAVSTVYGNSIALSGSGTATIQGRAYGVSTTNTLGGLTLGGQQLTITWGGSGGKPGLAFGAVSLVGSPTFVVNNEGSSNPSIVTLGSLSEDAPGRAFTLANPSSSILKLTASGSYSGGTTVNGGYLESAADFALGSGPLTVGANGKLRASSLNAFRSSTDGSPLPIALTGGGTLEFKYNGTGPFSNTVAVSGSGTATILGGYLNGTNTVLGALSVGGQTLSSSLWTIDGTSANANPTVTFNPVTLTGNATVNVQNTSNVKAGTWVFGSVGEDVTGNRSLTKTGVAQLKLSSEGNYTGGTSVNGGTLDASADYALGSGGVSIGGGGTLVASASNALCSAAAGHGPLTVTLAPAGVLIVRADTPTDFGANVVLSGSGTYTVNVGRVTFNTGISHALGTLSVSNQTLAVPSQDSFFTGGSTRNGGSDFGPIFAAVLMRGTATFNIGKEGSGNTMMMSLGPIGEDTPGCGLTKQNVGKLKLTGANTYSGDTTITGGTLVLSNTLALQASTLDYNYAGTLSIDAGISKATFGGLKGSTNLTLPSNFELTVGANGQNNTYDGQLSGTGASLTKSGTGTLTLSRTNSYTGPTVVTNGSLLIDGVLSANASTVTVYATLGGTGVINRLVIVPSNGVIMAGITGSASVLTVSSNLVMREGAQLHCDLTATDSDRIIVGKTLTLPTNAVVRISRSEGGLPTSTILLSANALTGATNSAKLTGWRVIGPVTGRVGIDGTNVVLSLPPAGTAFAVR